MHPRNTALPSEEQAKVFEQTGAERVESASRFAAEAAAEKAHEAQSALSREQQRTRLLRSEVEALRKELEIAKGSAAAIRTPRSRTVHSDDEEVDVTDPALFLEPQRGAQTQRQE